MLDRLQGTSLRITSQHPGRGGFQGALIRKFAWEDDENASLTKWGVFLEPEIVKLFSLNGYTQVFWEQRPRLKSSMVKYLHGYYATHEQPYPMKVATLQILSGSRAARPGWRAAGPLERLSQVQLVDGNSTASGATNDVDCS